MHPNPNKALTVLLSLIPGAGHMYLGLMRRGISFMLAFAGSILAASAFSFFTLFSIAFGLLIPVVWFVAFFDFWQYPRMTPEQQAEVKDEFLMVNQLSIPKGPVMRKLRVVAGLLLILTGLNLLYRYFGWYVLHELFRSQWMLELFDQLPRFLAAIAIIAVGLLLIFWKSRQLKKEARSHEE